MRTGKVGEIRRVWFAVQNGDGTPRLGLTGGSGGDFLVEVKDPADSFVTSPDVTESAFGDGEYFYDIPASFSTTHGPGVYGTIVRVITAPVSMASFPVQFFARDIDDAAIPGSEMDLVTDAVDANSVATSGANEIRDAILSDANAFAGADIAAILADTSVMEPLVSTNLDATVTSRESEAAALARAIVNVAEHDATQALVQLENDATQTLIAALNDLSIADVQTALTAQGYTVVRAALLDNLDALISSRGTADPGDEMALINNAITAVKIAVAALENDAFADNSINDRVLAPDTDSYQAIISLIDDDTTAVDRYQVSWLKNGVPVLASITIPTLRVFQMDAAGTELFAATALTEADAEGVFFLNQSTVADRVVDGINYAGLATATIDGSPRTWVGPVGRDRT